MKLKVNEIFNSFQGEGSWMGEPTTFVRLSGCNLQCSWCDTKHEQFQEYTPIELFEAVNSLGIQGHMVITGGEPTIQDLTDFLLMVRSHSNKNIRIAIETNGMRPEVLIILLEMQLLDWISVSPKNNMITNNIITSLQHADEIKVVLADDATPNIYMSVAQHLFVNRRAWIQPCSGHWGPAIKFCRENPQWRLGLQLHKVYDLR